VKIYTKRGDRGETDLLSGGRVRKDHLRVDAYGEVDELNGALGAALAASSHDDVRTLGIAIQSALFDIGSVLATPDPVRREKMGLHVIDDADIETLEAAIDRWESELEPLTSFILPGGTAAAAAFHLARSVCRRVERRAVSLDEQEPLEPPLLRYINRLSDLLFVMARVENRRAGIGDVEWRGRGG
jgi:cob(I)alamin adenosyltransferase